MMIKICDNITWERENIKGIGLVGPMGKMGCFSTFMVHLGLVDMGGSYHLVVTPLVDLWSFIFYLVLAPLLCVVPWPHLVWWLNLINFIVLLLCDHDLWYPTQSVLNFILRFIMVPLLGLLDLCCEMWTVISNPWAPTVKCKPKPSTL